MVIFLVVPACIGFWESPTQFTSWRELYGRVIALWVLVATVTSTAKMYLPFECISEFLAQGGTKSNLASSGTLHVCVLLDIECYFFQDLLLMHQLYQNILKSWCMIYRYAWAVVLCARGPRNPCGDAPWFSEQWSFVQGDHETHAELLPGSGYKCNIAALQWWNGPSPVDSFGCYTSCKSRRDGFRAMQRKPALWDDLSKPNICRINWTLRQLGQLQESNI